MVFETPEHGYVGQILNSLNETANVAVEWRGKTLHLTRAARSITGGTLARVKLGWFLPGAGERRQPAPDAKW